MAGKENGDPMPAIIWANDSSTHRNGCHDRADYVQSFPARDSIRIKGLSVTHGTVHIPFAMARDCQYTKSDLGQQDQGCASCKWHK